MRKTFREMVELSYQHIILSRLLPTVPGAKAVCVEHEQDYIYHQPYQRCQKDDATCVDSYFTSKHFIYLLPTLLDRKNHYCHKDNKSLEFKTLTTVHS